MGRDERVCTRWWFLRRALWRGTKMSNAALGVAMTLIALTGYGVVVVGWPWPAVAAAVAGSVAAVNVTALWWASGQLAAKDAELAALSAPGEVSFDLVPAGWDVGVIEYGGGRWQGRVLRLELANRSERPATFRVTAQVRGRAHLPQTTLRGKSSQEDWFELGKDQARTLDAVFVYERGQSVDPRTLTADSFLARPIVSSDYDSTMPLLQTHNHQKVGPALARNVLIWCSVDHREPMTTAPPREFHLTVVDSGDGTRDLELIPRS